MPGPNPHLWIAYRALHAADPAAVVAGPCRGLFGNGDPQDTIRLFKLGLGKYVDAYIAHPYMSATPEKDGMVQAIRTIREMLRASKKRDAPCTGPSRGGQLMRTLKEVQQAQVLMRENLTTRRGFPLQLRVHLLRLSDGRQPAGYGYNYNLVKGVPFGPDKVCPKPVAPPTRRRACCWTAASRAAQSSGSARASGDTCSSGLATGRWRFGATGTRRARPPFRPGPITFTSSTGWATNGSRTRRAEACV